MGPEFEALERKLQMMQLIAKNRDEYIKDEQIDPSAGAYLGLFYGEPYYFASPICDPLLKGATEAFTVPWRLIREVIPAPQGFFWFAKAPSAYTDPQHAGKNIPLRAISWTIFHLNKEVPPGVDPAVDKGLEVHLPVNGGGDMNTAAGILLQFYSEIQPGRVRPLGFTSWRFGRTQLEIVADEFRRMGQPEPTADELFKWGGKDDAAVAVAFQFLTQKLLSLSLQKNFNRAERKRLQREHPTFTAEPSVRVVVLRKRESLGYIHPEDQREVEWSSQWWVGAHWRMFHCMRPKLHASGQCWHQPVYIHTHTKGPLDAPLKPPPTTIFKVEH